MVCVSVVAVAAISYSCEMENTVKRAEEASKGTCDCIKKHSIKYCEDDLNKNYFVDEAFIKAFNKANDCGIKLTKK